VTQSIWLIVLLVLLASLALPAVIRPLLDRLGVVDVPNERSSHSQVAIRGVGLAPTLALGAGGLLLLAMVGSSAAWPILLACLATAIVAAGIGLAEDVRGIPTRNRALLQVGVGLVGAVAVIAVTDERFVWVPLGALAIAVYINAANFMDGIDGISGLHGMVVGTVYAVIGMMVGADWLVAGGAMLAAAFLGFLPWNVLRGLMFLGDVGSYLLGAMVAALAFAAFVDGVAPIALIAPVTLYLVDTGTTIFRRVRRGEPWFEAHRTHIYQRLTDRGLTHLQVASIVSIGSLVAGLAGLLAIDGTVPMTALSVALIALVAGLYVKSGQPLPKPTV
jgi:UDP-N-acetylmuramyl pentapeptide phosphotransferase/UDP-N-acetylglucosamine-1-phosphate transferase